MEGFAEPLVDLLIEYLYLLIIVINRASQQLAPHLQYTAQFTMLDSLTLRWKALHWGTLILAERYFLLIFIAVVSITSALSFLNKGFTVLGAVLIVVYLISFLSSLGLARFLRFISLRSNNKRLKVSFFDTNDEIESRLFNLIKELSLCLCIVDDSGNKHCGSLPPQGGWKSAPLNTCENLKEE